MKKKKKLSWKRNLKKHWPKLAGIFAILCIAFALVVPLSHQLIARNGSVDFGSDVVETIKDIVGLGSDSKDSSSESSSSGNGARTSGTSDDETSGGAGQSGGTLAATGSTLVTGLSSMFGTGTQNVSALSNDSGFGIESVDGGVITLDKWREKYELKAGESTKVHLTAVAGEVRDKLPAAVVLTLDMSGSMVSNNILTPTLNAARTAANKIAAENATLPEGSTKSPIAIVRYDTTASVYNFKTGTWVILDDQGSVENLGYDMVYSTSNSEILTALTPAKICSQISNTSPYYNNYPRANTINMIVPGSQLSPSGTSGIYPNYTQLDINSALSIPTTTNLATSYGGNQTHTNIEAGMIVTDFVANKVTNGTMSVYPLFMTDGYADYFQSSGTASGTKYSGINLAGLKYATPAFKLDNIGLNTNIPNASDPARTQATSAGNKLRAQISSSISPIENIYAIGVNKFNATYESYLVPIQQEVLTSLTGTTATETGGTTKNSFTTKDPAGKMEGIYSQIAQEIVGTPITSPVTITDVIPADFTLTTEAENALKAQAIAMGGTATVTRSSGKTTVIWTLPGLKTGEELHVSYEIVANAGSYGIVDTNENATLQYTNYCPEQDEIPNTSDPNRPENGGAGQIIGGDVVLTFPKPEVKLQPGAVNDLYIMPNNTDKLNSSDSRVDKGPGTGDSVKGNDPANTRKDQSPYDDDASKHSHTGWTATPNGDKNVQGLKVVVVDGLASDGSEGTLSFNESTGTFDYTPNPDRPKDSGKEYYEVTYTYRYESTDSGKAYVSDPVTVTIRVPVSDTPPVTQNVNVIKMTEGGNYPVAGATFTLTSFATGGKLTGVTNSEGKIIFEDVDPGMYVLAESIAPNGYEVYTQTHFVTVTAGSDAEVSLTNVLKPFDIVINKVDENGDPLKDATFEIRDSDGLLVDSDQTSGQNGKITFANIATPGTYTIKETAAPNGYRQLTSEFEIKIGQNSSGAFAEITRDGNPYSEDVSWTYSESLGHYVLTFKVKNSKKGEELPDKGNLRILKINQGNRADDAITNTGEAIPELDAETGIPDVWFAVIPLWNKSGVNYESLKTYANAKDFYDDHKSDPDVHIVKTNASGLINLTDLPVNSSDLSDSRYLILELNDAGHELPSSIAKTANPIIINIPTMNADGKGYNFTVNVYPKNELVLSSVELTKTGEDGALAGAEFRLEKKNASGVYVPYGTNPHTTNGSGVITVGNLPAGEYQFIETAAPTGYVVDATPQKFTVDASTHKKTIEISMVNYKETETPTKSADKTSAGHGDEITWTIKQKIPGNVKSLTKFEIYDKLDSKTTYVDSSVSIAGLSSPGDYSVAFDSGTNTLSIKLTTTGIGKLTAGEDLTVTFKSKVTTRVPGDIKNVANVVTDNTDKNTNEVQVEIGGYMFQKVNEAGQPLKDAVFIIRNEAGKYLQQTADGNVWLDEADKGQATEFRSGTDGKFEVTGLAHGTYYLVEIQAPSDANGQYGLITEEFSVTAGVYKEECRHVITNYLVPTLPITGGVGIVSFLAVGLLIMGAAWWYYNKNRVNHSDSNR